MLVLSVEILALVILYAFSKRIGKEKYCFVAAVVLTFFAALRSSIVGPDGLVYAQYFKDVQELSYSGIFLKFDKEPLFYVTIKLLQELGVTLQVWYAIIGGMFAFAIMFIVRQYSQQPLVSILAMFSLGYYTFSFTGLRQTMALSIVTISFYFIEKKKYMWGIWLILFASIFHNSALIFLLVVLIRDRKLKIWQYALGMLVGLGLVILFRPQVYAFISETVESIERFEGYAGYTHGLSWAGFIIQCMIFIFCIIVYNGKDKQYLLNVSFQGVAFQMLAVLMAEFFRISMYFNVFNIILLGNVYCQNRFSTNSKIMAKILIIVALVFYFINSHVGYQYMFYWQ